MEARDKRAAEQGKGKIMRNSFVLYTEYAKQISLLTMEQRGQLLTAIIQYVTDGTVPELDAVTEMAFSIIQIRLDRDEEKSHRGRYHWNWKGGITPLNRMDRSSAKYQYFRKCVLERDGYTCQKCGKTGGTLNVHHILRFSDYVGLRFDPSNGITLCEKCHREVHKNEKQHGIL